MSCCNWMSSFIGFLLRCRRPLSVIPAHAGIQEWMRGFPVVRRSRPWTPAGVYPEPRRRAGVTVSSKPIAMRMSTLFENDIYLRRGGNAHDIR